MGCYVGRGWCVSVCALDSYYYDYSRAISDDALDSSFAFCGWGTGYGRNTEKGSKRYSVYVGDLGGRILSCQRNNIADNFHNITAIIIPR
jgi:hypothetical protein